MKLSFYNFIEILKQVRKMGKKIDEFNSLLNSLLRTPVYELFYQFNGKYVIVTMKVKDKILMIELDTSIKDSDQRNLVSTYNGEKYVGHLKPLLLKDVESLSYSLPEFEPYQSVQDKETYTTYIVRNIRLQPKGWEYEVGYLNWKKEECLQDPIKYNPMTKVDFNFKVPELSWSDSYYDGKSLNESLESKITKTETLTFQELGIPEHCYGNVLHNDAKRIIWEYRNKFVMYNLIWYFSDININTK